MENKIIDNKLIVYVDRSLYSADVITKCLYWYGDRFNASFSVLDERRFEIVLEAINASDRTEEHLKEFLSKLQRDLIDFRLRDVVNKETRTIRELLIAKAFSRFDVDHQPKQDYRDPVEKKKNL